MKSKAPGRVYSTVTKYWPRIAAGLVALLGVGELVLGGLTADNSLEFYLTAWAATTGGLWFLFEKAETALSEESRKKVLGWLETRDFKRGIGSIPLQFVLLFDKVFGERHWSWKCFLRSCVASMGASFVVLALLVTTGAGGFGDYLLQRVSTGFANIVDLANGIAVLSVMLTFLPDYISLLETRWGIQRMKDRGGLFTLLLFDLVATSAISLGWIFLIFNVFGVFTNVSMGAVVLGDDPASLFFYSSFFTSVWLWLYIMAVMLSRLLLRMNHGLGFLLRVTDVERQPFRSMGFVSVIIVSGLFALGLPLILL